MAKSEELKKKDSLKLTFKRLLFVAKFLILFPTLVC